MSISPKNSRKIVWMVATGHGLAHLYLLVLPPLYPVISADLGLSYTQLGMVFSVAAFSLGISQMVVGVLSDRIGYRLLLIGGQFLMSFGVLASGMATSFWTLAVFQAAVGLGGSVMHPVAVALLNESLPEGQRGKALGIHGSAAQTGNAAAPALMVWLALAFSWRTALIVTGMAGVLLSVWMHRHISGAIEPTSRGADKEPTAFSAALPFGKTALGLALLIWVSRGIAARAYQSFLPTFLIERHAFSLERTSVFVTLYWIVAAAASLFGGYLADRTNHYQLLWASTFFSTAALAILLFQPSLPEIIIYGNFFCLGAFSFLGRPAFYGIYGEGFKSARSGTFYAIGFTAAYTLSAVIPGAMGWLTDNYGSSVAFYPVLAAMGTPLIILPLLKWIRKRYKCLISEPAL